MPVDERADPPRRARAREPRGERALAALLLGALGSLTASSAQAQPAKPDLHGEDERNPERAPPVPGANPPVALPPVVKTHEDPVYPSEALPARQHGDVLLALTVDVDGHVSKVEVLESGGRYPDEAAVVAARQWTFDPATRGGKPVASRIRVPFHFAPPAEAPEIVEAQTAPGDVPVHEAAQPPPRTAPAPPVEEVRVVGRSKPPSRGASDFDLDVGQLANVPRKNATELLTLAPGVLLTNEGGEGHAEQVFLRGFDAREGQDVEFSVGHVPVNESGNLHGNGYADTHFVIPELVESLRILEGPFDPRQGNYAVAGSADYELGLERRGLTAKGTLGSFGTRRLLLTFGPPGESRHTFGGAEVYQTDGFGQNRDAHRASAMGQYEGRVGERGSFRVLATAYGASYHSAGVLRDDDFRSGRVGFYDTYDPLQGGDATRFSITADLETRGNDVTFGNQVFAVARSMGIRDNFTGFLLDVQTPLQTPHGQRGDLIDVNMHEATFGARGFAKLQAPLADQKQELELGYFARGDQVRGVQQRLEATTGHPYRTDTDLDSTLGDLGLYADAIARFTSYVQLRGGLRADLFTYDVNDLCAVQSVAHPSKTRPPGDASCLSQADFGAYREPNQRATTASTTFLPRASLVVGPFVGLTFSGSFGQGVRSIDPSYITQDVKTPFANVDAWEGGASYLHALGAAGTLDARSVFFSTHVDRDLIFDETAGRNVLGGGTTRTGWTGTARFRGAFFDEAASVTLVKSRYDDTHLLVPYVPDAVVRSDTAFFSDLPWSTNGLPWRGTLAGGVTYIGRRALPFGERSNTIFTVDASASVAWSWLEVSFAATNLLGQTYRLGEYDFASDFRTQSSPTLVPVRQFTAGAPRALFLSVAVTLGGSS